MSEDSWGIQPALQHYLQTINAAEAPLLRQIRQETAQHRQGLMHIATEQAQTLTWLARLMRVERYLEIGVFTGYSSTAMAMALPEHARITACDISVTYTDCARRYWQQAGVAHKIQLYVQPALITLDQLLANGAANSYDLAFIDADKPPTAHYYERCLQLVRPGGVVAIDNVLLGGRVLLPAHTDHPPSVALLQQFNASLAQDPRILPLTLPIGDGLTLLQKC